MFVEFLLREVVSFFVAGTIYFSNSNWFDLLVSIIGCIGLYGFVFKKRIVSKEIWKIFLFAIIVTLFWDAYNFIAGIPLSQSEIEFIDFLFSAIGFLVFIPFCVGIFMYGFKSNELWDI